MAAKPGAHLGAGFFGMQAAVGITKHMGGLEATRELVGLCHVQEAHEVLDAAPAIRQLIKQQFAVPPDIFRFAGYGLLTGKKPKLRESARQCASAVRDHAIDSSP
jgi:hypothetical protein